jgi:serine/threonine protein kinase/Flp pilus assembly protein TadD
MNSLSGCSPNNAANSLETLVGQVADEFTERLRDGEHPEIEEYAARYPQIAEVLHQVLPALQVMGGPATDSLADDEAADLTAALRGCLGDFRLLREIGRGGMGIVYEAEQISLGRRVALKILPFVAALDAKQLQRFKKEAQAAAHLQHQSIVPVYYVGCERGVHFYAMQFIQGRTLAEVICELRSGLAKEGCPSSNPRPSQSVADPVAPAACSADAAPSPDTFLVAALSTERSARRSEFFRTVARLGMQAAEALEHAHQENIIHRDIKPANLLVNTKGNLWITDFGLARLQNDTSLTLSGDVVGTLRYMSPEQALGHTTAVDHHTDVYALGATLYEFVCLRPVFDGRDRQELLRQIASEEPCSPRRLNPAVPLELEIIIQKALEKEPAARYGTAQELADDLRRFLEDKPIRARRPSWLERARKWARRHRPAVWSAAVGSLMVLIVLAGSVGWVVRDRGIRQAKIATDLQAAVEEAERSQREGKWPQAQAAAKRAEALLEDGAAEPGLAQRVQCLLRELAEEEADRRLLARLEEIRLLQAEVNVKQDRFLLERALPEYQQAFKDYGLQMEARAPPEAAALIRCRPPAVRGTLVATLDHWLDLARREKSSEANWLERVLSAADSDAWRQRLRAARGRRDRQALEQLAREVDVATQPPQTLFLLDRALDAWGAKEDSVAILRRAQEAYPGDFWTNQNLGMALLESQPPQLDEAIRFMTVAVALRPESSGARLNLGLAFGNKGRLHEAINACRKAIELKADYGMAYFHLGRFLWRVGQLDEAVAACRRAVELKADYAEAHSNLGGALLAKGRLDEAVAACRQAIGQKPDLPQPYYIVANALRVKGRIDEAIAAYAQAIDRKPDYAEAHCDLGIALQSNGRLHEAIAAFRKAVELRPDLFNAHFNLGGALFREGRFDEAVAALRRVVELKPDFPMVHYELGNVLRTKGQIGEAVAAYRRAIELRPDYAEAYCNLGSTLRQQGEFGQALVALKRGHELGSRRPDWYYASARWVEECQRLCELESRLPVILRGEAQPANTAEQHAYALFCYDQRRFAASARLSASILTADSKLADNLERGYRYEAACRAALAGCGQGTDANQLDDKERMRWRKQALQWLQADLAAYGKRLESGKARNRQMVRQRLQGWLGNQDLAGVREPSAVAKLPDEEEKAWKQLWTDVQGLLTKVEVGTWADPPRR